MNMIFDRDSALAEDLVQEAFFAAYNNWSDVQQMDLPFAWLVRVVTWQFAKVLRTRRRRPAAAVGGLGELPLGGADPEPGLLQSLDLERTMACFDQRDTAIALARYRLGMTQAEIAEHLGLSRRTVGVRLRRIEGAVARTLGGSDGDGLSRDV